jgi:PAS domain S-box-containing protein
MAQNSPNLPVLGDTGDGNISPSEPTAKNSRGKKRRSIEFVYAILIPFVASGLQWFLWDYISPFVWFLFFPAVFFSARLSGFWGGLFSTIISAALVVYFFIPPQLSWSVNNLYNLFSVGMFIMMGYLFSDIQERFRAATQRTEEALAETRAAHDKISLLYQKTLELDELKTQFFANVSHELRTPLTLILGPVKKALGASAVSPDIRHDLEVIERNARFLYRQVTDLLDISKLDAGRMAIQYSQINLAQLARVTASQFETIAAEREISIAFEAPEYLVAQVDVNKCQRILLNLLSNAFKFTPGGGQVRMSLTADDVYTIFQIADSGPGIPQDKRQVVFERFRQLDGNTSRKHGGTGLGLSIVREFVLLHNGEIRIDDSPLGGAMFTVRLPRYAPAGAVVSEPDQAGDTSGDQLVAELSMEQNPVQEDDLSGSEILPLVLVVEDNPDMNEFVAALLKPHYRVARAVDGKTGLAKALALTPDLILADVMMPTMSGDQMVLAIRQEDRLKEIPVIMLTAKADEKLRVELLQGQVQDYINKPFAADELLARVENLLVERRRAAEKIRASELRYQNLFENMVEGLAYCQMIFENGQPVDWVYLSVNPAFETLTGLKNAGGKRVTELIPGIRENSPTLFDIYARVATSGTPEKFEIHLETLHQWFSVSVYGPEPGYFVAVFDVITARKSAEEALRASEEKYRFLVENITDVVWQISTDYRFTYVSPTDERQRGYTADEVLGKTIFDFMAEKSKNEVMERAYARRMIMEKGERLSAAVFEIEQIRKDGILIWTEVTSNPVYDQTGCLLYYQGVTRDITERKRADEQIRKSLSEKEVLLRELYHRTKNNMNVITALLEIQAADIDDERLKTAFTEAEHRIYSMALAHQKLYEANDLSRLNLKEYLQDLLESLRKSLNISASQISIVSEMEDVFILIDTAIPCGLILNELISNIFKYAFPDNRNGEIRLQLRRNESGEVDIRISDNGVGVPPGFDFHRDGHLGMQSIFLLGEGQLKGQVIFETGQGGGLACHITFLDIHYQPRV